MASISGRVTDTSGTIPISGATVWLKKSETVLTDADGRFTLTGIGVIKGQIIQEFPCKVSALIKNGLLQINVTEESPVEVVAYTLQGKIISNIQKTVAAGTHSIAFSHRGEGVYLYKVKLGNNDFLLYGNSIGGILQETALSHHALAKKSTDSAAFNDMIVITKEGYLNNQMIVTSSDISGLEIKLILQDAGTVTDIEGNIYHAIRIGNQIWTVENLRTTKYNDGSAIPLVTDNLAWKMGTTPAYCYFNNTNDEDSMKRFGVLYNWYAVDTKKLAPAGWHVPADSEWTILVNPIQ